MAAANGGDNVPDTWDGSSGGTGDSESQMNSAFAMKLNVNAPVFTPGQNVFAPAFVPFQATPENSQTTTNAGSVDTGTIVGLTDHRFCVEISPL